MPLREPELPESHRTVWAQPESLALFCLPSRATVAHLAEHRPVYSCLQNCALCIWNLSARVTYKCPYDLNPKSSPSQQNLPDPHAAGLSIWQPAGESRTLLRGWSPAHCRGNTPGATDF